MTGQSFITKGNMFRRHRKSLKPYIPSRTDGTLYYVRLKTEVGILYKLGFTNQASVEARFNFNGGDDYKLVDEILLFSYFEDAHEIEQALHLHFSSAFGRFSSNPMMPLHSNGQSELYATDILKLDPGFTQAQEIKTLKAIKQRTDQLPLWARAVVVVIVAVVEVVLRLAIVPFLKVASWLIPRVLARLNIEPEVDHEREKWKLRDKHERAVRERRIASLIERIGKQGVAALATAAQATQDDLRVQRQATLRELKARSPDASVT